MKSILVAVLLLVSTVAFGQPDPAERGHGRHPGERMIERLKLTPDQQKQLHALRIRMMKKQVDLRYNIQKNRIDLADLMQADQLNKGAIESAQKEINNLQGEIKLNRTDFWFAVNAMLSPDQQKEWKMAPQFMMERMRQHRGMMMQGRGMMNHHRMESLNDDDASGDDGEADLLPPFEAPPELPGE